MGKRGIGRIGFFLGGEGGGGRGSVSNTNMAGNKPCVTRNNFSLVHPTRCVSLLLQSIGEGEKGLVVEDAVQRAMKVRWEWGVICGRWRESMEVCYSYGERRKLRAAVYCVWGYGFRCEHAQKTMMGILTQHEHRKSTLFFDMSAYQKPSAPYGIPYQATRDQTHTILIFIRDKLVGLRDWILTNYPTGPPPNPRRAR